MLPILVESNDLVPAGAQSVVRASDGVHPVDPLLNGFFPMLPWLDVFAALPVVVPIPHGAP